MTRHDEPNEYGFAGDVTLPEPERPHKRDVVEEEAEDVAVPGSDLSREFQEALADSDQVDEADEGEERPSSR
ncbi:hypothetical protein GCM10022225_53540 [Plantactinospora mayteni]|uniref:DUF5709 domain-containing protein n=1 Tax=Plantactinospora mayteni TaxID=566021 RepID=A0ABQ4EJP1_9ACTN|nr:hypothetical protein [Plantactinospora mayteni]GIG94972.1 hypothetical protein Pma05_15450 [Plantactinospora mayteni]